MAAGIELDADPLAHEAHRRRRRLLIALGIAAVLIVALALAFGDRGKQATAKESALQRVTVTIPGRSTIAAAVTASGTIGARHDMPVGIVGDGGMVAQVLAEAGQWVAAGQTLAVVERSVQTQQAASLAAGVRVAEADASLAQSNLERARALVKNGFISKADIDAKTAARDQAVARVAVARAQLAEQNARNARLMIRAPAAGLVLARAVEAGQIVQPSSGALFRVAAQGDMEMQARVAEQDLARMHVGTLADVTPIGSTRRFQGQVWLLSPIIDPNTRQGVVRIALRYDPALRPGGFASARIDTGEAEVPLLPESAVLSDDKGNYVLVIDRDGIVQRRAVTVGDVSDKGVSIAKGLDGHEKVVVSAGAFLTPGEKVLPTTQPTGH